MALSLCDFSGDPTSIATEPYFFLLFFGGGGGAGGGVVAGVDTTNCIIKKYPNKIYPNTVGATAKPCADTEETGGPYPPPHP